ncbi:hypothetical protein BwSH20_41990 [Bradyrhizobium ottawaense]|nr:hypothetical protein SG09_53740 [Bradyrhizobium ottawaense]BBO12833.1 hypothetical protein TM102_43030 [Bradyrhizobium sp. TM102]GMO17386.1 hypothetical protein TM233_22600 [Bradyrhizobium sp. TM233]GMP01707.1 hypothetical protein TM239_29440 [Bradyrhizobium sp. TM239]GMO18326.1 hypothetical protein BwSH14_09560 [Bradyrhizobium ottawaense]
MSHSASRCSAGTLKVWEFQRFPFPSKTSAVRGSEVERVKRRRRTVLGYLSRYRDSSDSDVTHYPVP